MSKGFGTQPIRDNDWVIQNIQKNTKALRGDLQFKRQLMTNLWESTHKKNQYPAPPLMSMFAPYGGHSCLVAETPSKYSVAGNHNRQYVFFANTDFWYVLVKRENDSLNRHAHRNVCGVPQPKLKKDHYEFQIGVKVGPYPFFMPSLIKERICGWHGRDVYESWRKMVKADLPNLAPYITAFNPPKNLYSFTCDDSSARVCESLGLPVRHGVAYWLRQEDADLKSEVVAEVVKGTAVSGLNLQSCFGKQKISLTETVTNYLMYGPGNLLDFSKMLQAA
jgi:hypothetical protein